MRARPWWVMAVVLVAGTADNSAGQAPGPDPAAVKAIVDTIDKHLVAGWKKAGVTPAARSDDAEFLRRVYLDLAGRIPSVTEARQFLGDKSPDARHRLVQRLLGGQRYVQHFTLVWRHWWLPETLANPELQFYGGLFDAWLRERLAANTRYDQIVREILTAPLPPASDSNTIDLGLLYGGGGPVDPLAFYGVRGSKPDEVAAAVSRAFLGVKLECAQCHDHPFADWRKDQFWSLAAFFAGMPRNLGGPQIIFDGFGRGRSPSPQENIAVREIKIPGSERVVPAAFLDGGKPKWKEATSPRVTLADWLIAKENPFFARAAVNRLWAYFFGTGLVDPVDDMAGTHNLASHPELLDELARAFAEHKFDLKLLIAGITSSEAYQLTSAGKGGVEARLFARMPVRGLTPDQLWDSLAQATGLDHPGRASALRAEFVGNFISPEKATDAQTTILHALTLMNGKVVADATSLSRSEALAAVLDAPFMDTKARIETLFLAALARSPRPAELARFVRHVEAGGAAGYNRALADVFWVLLNSGEFLLNH